MEQQSAKVDLPVEFLRIFQVFVSNYYILWVSSRTVYNVYLRTQWSRLSVNGLTIRKDDQPPQQLERFRLIIN